MIVKSLIFLFTDIGMIAVERKDSLSLSFFLTFFSLYAFLNKPVSECLLIPHYPSVCLFFVFLFVYLSPVSSPSLSLSLHTPSDSIPSSHVHSRNVTLITSSYISQERKILNIIEAETSSTTNSSAQFSASVPLSQQIMPVPMKRTSRISPSYRHFMEVINSYDTQKQVDDVGSGIESIKGPIIVIIRHGKTEHNKLGLFTGWEDAPLAAEGTYDTSTYTCRNRHATHADTHTHTHTRMHTFTHSRSHIHTFTFHTHYSFIYLSLTHTTLSFSLSCT